MKRERVWMAITLSVALGSAHVQALDGASTMSALAIDVLATCPGAAPLTYAGVGSTLAGSAMANGLQQVAPQSRFLSAAECTVSTPPGQPNTGQGLRVALDAVSVWKDKTEHQFECLGDAANCNNWPSFDEGGLNISSSVGGPVTPNPTTGRDCRVMRYAGCMTLQNLNGRPEIDDGVVTLGASGNAETPLVDGQYCFTHWADALRIIYTCQHQHLNDSSVGSACAAVPAVVGSSVTMRCNSDVRLTLVENWSNIFDYVGDDGAGGCTDKNCTRLEHAYRPNDFSGTTDTFLQLIGAPAATDSGIVEVIGGFADASGAAAAARPAPRRTFANGLDNEDLDPIRRPCSRATNANLDPQSVCAPIPFKNRNAPISSITGGPTGAPGAIAPTPPSPTDLADLGLVLSISPPPPPTGVTDAAWHAVQYNPAFCTPTPFGGIFKFASMPTVALPNAQRCPDGNFRVGGQCRWPVSTAGKFNCTARRTNRPGGITWASFDARAYNLTPRHPDTGSILQPNAGAIVDARWGGGGHYRMHQLFAMAPPLAGLAQQSPAAAGPLKAVHPACILPNATEQIGCLVEANYCSIGVAGLPANDPTPPHLPFTEGSKNLHSPQFTSGTPNEVGTNWPLLLRAAYDPNTSDMLPAGGAVRDYTCNPSLIGWWGNPRSVDGDWEIDPLTQLDCGATVHSNEGEPSRAAIHRVLDVSNMANCNVAGNFHIRYPLSRALWINASEGFGFTTPVVTGPVTLPAASPVTGTEAAFAQCMANMPDAVVEAHAFVPLPAGANRLRVCP